MTNKRAPHRPLTLAIWYGKGGVGKSTTTLLLSLLAAKSGRKVLAIDLDPECGTSRDFLGDEVRRLPDNLLTFLDAPLTLPPPIVPSGIANLDLVAAPPDQQRFFRHYAEHSTRLRNGLQLLPPTYDWLFMDIPNQFDNIAELGLIASEYVILPVELTADCLERVPTVLRVLQEATAINPALHVVGALVLASAPRARQTQGLSAKERLVYREYETALASAGIRPFRTIMFRSATSVEEARSNANERLLHWTARRRFKRLFAEIHSRIRLHELSISRNLSHKRHGQPSHRKQGRNKTTANA